MHTCVVMHYMLDLIHVMCPRSRCIAHSCHICPRCSSSLSYAHVVAYSCHICPRYSSTVPYAYAVADSCHICPRCSSVMPHAHVIAHTWFMTIYAHVVCSSSMSYVHVVAHPTSIPYSHNNSNSNNNVRCCSYILYNLIIYSELAYTHL